MSSYAAFRLIVMSMTIAGACGSRECPTRVEPSNVIADASVVVSDDARDQDRVHDLFDLHSLSKGVLELLVLRQNGKPNRAAFDGAIRWLVIAACELRSSDTATADYVLNAPIDKLFPMEDLSRATAAGCCYLIVDDRPVFGADARRDPGCRSGYTRSSDLFQTLSLSRGLLEILQMRGSATLDRKRLDHALKLLLVYRCGIFPTHSESVQHLLQTPLEDRFALEHIDKATTLDCVNLVGDEGLIRRQQPKAK